MHSLLSRQRVVKLHIHKTQLPTADYGLSSEDGEGRYVLEGHRHTVIIERKRGIDEIANNCLVPWRRKLFENELMRLRQGWRHPILFLEGDHSTYLTPTRHNPKPGLVLDAFLDLMVAYDIPVHLLRMSSIAHRRASGEWAARLLIRGAMSNGQSGRIQSSPSPS